jgi:hypothetical protein
MSETTVLLHRILTRLNVRDDVAINVRTKVVHAVYNWNPAQTVCGITPSDWNNLTLVPNQPVTCKNCLEPGHNNLHIGASDNYKGEL